VGLEETARALGTLVKTGWRPARTIILAGWDGEEWGLLGSTEWAEKHSIALDANAVAYLNSDSNDRSWLNVGGSHSLETRMYEVARDINDTVKRASVLDAMMERRARREASAPTSPAAPQAARPDTGARAAEARAAAADSARTPDDSLIAREQRRIQGERRTPAD